LVLFSEINLSKNNIGTRAMRISIPKPGNKKGRDSRIEPAQTRKAIILVFLFSLKFILLPPKM
jgi:hypothetical protein